MVVVNGKCIEYDNIRDEYEARRMEHDWQAHVKGILKAELKRKGISYIELAEKLHAIGVKENDANIRTKISRGGFTAVFFFQCMVAIGAHTIHIEAP